MNKKIIILSVCLALIVVPLRAQGGSGIKQAKTAELNALLKTKGWTLSDIAKYIPYNIVTVDVAFNSWFKAKDIVFYKTTNGQLRAIMPTDADGNTRADYKEKVGVNVPVGYFDAWKKFFADRCRQHGSAEYVLSDYQHGRLSLTDCISQMKASEDPKSYIAYMRNFVLYAIKKDAGAWNCLYAALGDVFKKNDKTGICLAAMLCRTTDDTKKWIAVWKQIPVNKYYYGCNDETYKTFGSSSIDAVKGEYGGCLSGINTYFDGRVVMRSDNAAISTSELKSVESRLDVYKGQGYTFLYSPKGENLYGFLKKKGTPFHLMQVSDPILWGANTKHTGGEQFDLCAGYTLNEKGEVTGGQFIDKTLQDYVVSSGKRQYSADEIDAAKNKYKEKQEEIAAQQEEITISQEDKEDIIFMDQQAKRLMKKYGEKPVWAMAKFRPYEGMPSGILNEFVMVLRGIKFKMWRRVVDYHWSGEVYRLSETVPVSQNDDIIVYCSGGKVRVVNHKGRL